MVNLKFNKVKRKASYVKPYVPMFLCGSRKPVQRRLKKSFSFLLLFLISFTLFAQPREFINFNNDWKFYLGDDSAASQPDFDDSQWRTLNVPHDWSIEGEFSKEHPTTFNQGALPAGIGWYRKTLTLPTSATAKIVYINFDGVYRNSEVWINGQFLRRRPNGYISFRYELTPYLKSGGKNVIAVRVDNSAQPNSRWYTGSGIYRKVWLEATDSVAIGRWGVFVSTPQVSSKEASINIQCQIRNATDITQPVTIIHEIFDAAGKLVTKAQTANALTVTDGYADATANAIIKNPKRWGVQTPYLYRVVTKVFRSGKQVDAYTTPFGIRTFSFDVAKGFFLNEKPLKILGVCNHHDLGALGAAFNTRAAERQLQILKAMGCNAIRTAHNPPAPELLDLCDRIGFLVMDEAFDMWKKRKNRFDYNVDFDAWYKQDLADMVRRDRNHPSVFCWSIGNEIREQFDSTGTRLAKEMADIVKGLDPTRPVTSALTENVPEKNYIWQSGALDVLGFNYKHADYPELPKHFPGQTFIATETASALSTRGYYEMPSDSNRLWPPDSKSTAHGNPDHTVSAYDNTYAYWGATHEQSWKAVKKQSFIAGLFVWSGFDFLGEPVPYSWPSRSSYYGIIDLAGFPKDVYYLYQSEWTTKPVLHIFPHWNWKVGDSVDVWAYYNNADEVELFLNGKSLGKKRKEGDSLHIQWRVKYEPGTLKAVSKKKGKIVLVKERKTAGPAAKIVLEADRKVIKATSDDLSFVTVKITDANGNIVPYADNQVTFTLSGPAVLAGVDNGNPVSMESFKALERKAFHGLCLAIIQPAGKKGNILLQARADGLPVTSVRLKAN